MLPPKPKTSFSTLFFLSQFHTALSLPKPSYSKPLSLLADHCTSLKQLLQVHAQMVVSARILDNFAASRILSFAALSPSGNLDHALRLFHHTQEPNSFMWNTIIRALADCPDPSHAILFYRKMRNLCVLPGKHTFPFVLKACTNIGSLFAGKQIHAQVLKFALDFDVYVGNGLIRCYMCCGHIADARLVFDEISEKNLFVWTSLVSGYAQNLCSNEALMLFDQMIGEGIEPNSATLASVLSACARSGGLDMGEQIHSFIKEKGIEVGVILGTALVDMYAKNGVICKAKALFDIMPDKNIVTWNAIICGLATHGDAERAIELFRELERKKVVPTDITFVGVLSACCHVGLLEVGRDIFYSMQNVYGIEPKVEHYGCMVDLLGRSGRLQEAEELTRAMKWRADVVVWGALLTACKNCGNIEIAERVVKEILKLEPHNHGVYVVLSNMYAEVGRWGEVVRLRKVMKDGGLKKIPGWSLVDGENS